MPEDKDFTYHHGAHTDFLFGKREEDEFFNLLRPVVTSAEPLSASEGEPRKILMCDGENTPIRRVIINLLNTKSKQIEFRGIYPHLKIGNSYNIKISDIRIWDDEDIEANALGVFEDGHEIGFYLPFFPLVKDTLCPDTWYKMSLSGIACLAGKVDAPDFFEIREGPLWDNHKKDYLEEHPNTPEIEIPSARLEMGNLAYFNSIDDYADHYSFIGRIENPQRFVFDGRNYCLFEADAIHMGETRRLHLCANIDESKDLKFEEGERISACVWLHGFDFKKLAGEELKSVEDKLSELRSNEINPFAFYDLIATGWPEAIYLTAGNIPNKYELLNFEDNDEFCSIKLAKDGKEYIVNIASTISGMKSKFTMADIEALSEEEKSRTCFVNLTFERDGKYLTPNYEDVYNCKNILGELRLPMQFRHIQNHDACDLFAAFINEKNINRLSGEFTKVTYYKSYWADKEITGDKAISDHLKKFLLNAKTDGVEFWAKTGIYHGNEDMPCVLVYRDSPENLVNITVLTTRFGRVAEIYVLDPEGQKYSINQIQHGDKWISIKDCDDNFGIVNISSEES